MRIHLKCTFLIALLSCFATQTISAQSDIATPAVTVTTVESRELTSRTIVSGTLIPRDDVLIMPEVEGLVITDILVDEGASVQKGAILARLDARILTILATQNKAQIARIDASIAQSKAQIAEAEANKVQANNAYARTTSLLKSGSSSADSYDQKAASSKGADARLNSARQSLEIALADRASAEATLSDTELKLSRTEIKAPVNGIIYRRNATLGALSSASGEPLFRMTRDGMIELEAEISELDMANLKQNQSVQLNIAGIKLPVSGMVRLLSPQIDKTTRLGKIRISIAKDVSLLNGSFARATIETGRKKAITVPLSALTYTKAGSFVQSVVNSKIVSKPVEVGMIGDGRAEILSGVVLDDVVVARAGTFVRDGDTIRAMQEKQ